MMLFLILCPFAVFTGLMLVASPAVSLFAAAAVALATVAFDLAAGRSLKIMAAGSATIFLGIGGYVALVDPHVSVLSVRIAVDLGVLAIALGSLAIRFPFTLQYGREIVDAETAALPGFRHANYIITLVWTAAFVLMLIANMLMVYMPTLPLWVAIGIAFAARNCAVYFTRWYPQHRRSKELQASTT